MSLWAPSRGQPAAAMDAEGLRDDAARLGQSLPPLLAEAEQLAANVAFGAHGRRRSGQGDEFWQYRPAHPGDPLRLIDWRRSARSDGHFLREREWQAAQSVSLWVDPAQSMAFRGAKSPGSKRHQAQLLALSLATLLLRGGERVALAGAGPDAARPRAGRGQILRLAQYLTALAGMDASEGAALAEDYGSAPRDAVLAHGRAVFFSDFLGPLAAVETALSAASSLGAKGVLFQILDPEEIAFPYRGRVVFTSMGGGLRHETQEAAGLRARYLEKLAARRDRLAAMARACDWQFFTHDTEGGAQAALLWLYRALEGGGR